MQAGDFGGGEKGRWLRVELHRKSECVCLKVCAMLVGLGHERMRSIPAGSFCFLQRRMHMG